MELEHYRSAEVFKQKVLLPLYGALRLKILKPLPQPSELAIPLHGTGHMKS